MSNPLPDFTAILLQRGVLTPPQLEEARRLRRQTGCRLEDALIRLGYATPENVAEAVAEAHGVPFIDLTAVTIPQAVIELIPESVARENAVLPMALAGSALLVIMSDPGDMDVRQKLSFILNKDIRPVVAPRQQIVEAINHYYGQTQTESVDCMLAEFTDTAIDFTHTEALGDEVSEDEELSLDDSADSAPAASGHCLEEMSPADEPATRSRKRSGAPVERQATVRYYQQMNPERMFPLLVVLSRKAVQEVVKRGVAQAASKRFRVEPDAPVEVEPILPGCHCYPAKEHVAVDAEQASVTFWVVPHVLGKVMHARVVVRQEGRVLAEVPLEVRVVRQTLAVLVGGLSLVLPFALMVCKHFRLDFESQLTDGFGLYAQAANWALHGLSPEVLAGALLLVTLGVYLWLRPRRRDVFWDVSTAAPAQRGNDAGMLLAAQDTGEEQARHDPGPDGAGELQAALFAQAERHFAGREYGTALRFYESGLALGRARQVVYHHASLSAHQAGNTSRALAILQTAEAELPDAEIRGPLWYNLGCFAARLGRLDDALHYLNRAADHGCTDPDKYQNDPDLAPLRWRRDFNKLLSSLRSQVTT
jgi:hypothetical protein